MSSQRQATALEIDQPVAIVAEGAPQGNERRLSRARGAASRLSWLANNVSPRIHNANIRGIGNRQGVFYRFAIGNCQEPPAAGPLKLPQPIAQRGRSFDFYRQIVSVNVEAVGRKITHPISLDQSAYDGCVSLVGHG